MAKQIITLDEGLAHLEDGRTIDLLAIQATLNAAFQEHGDPEFAEAANELSKITQKWQGPHGEFFDGTYEDEVDFDKPLADSVTPTNVAYQGYVSLYGSSVDVEFQAPARASVAELDAAFMAALAQKAEISYFPSEGAVEPVEPDEPLPVADSVAVEVRKVLVLSTAHLTKETCLGYKAWPFIAEYEEGCYFYVGPEPETYADAPSDLQTVLAFAKKHGCVEIKFDRDADQVSDLPVYDW